MTLSRVAAAAVFLLFAATPANAQGPCAPRDAMLSTLLSKYGEVPADRGITPDGSLTVITANPATRTFSIIVIVVLPAR